MSLLEGPAILLFKGKSLMKALEVRKFAINLGGLGPLAVEFKHLAFQAIPLAVANLGHMLMGVVDILMVGNLGEKALGAVSLGNTCVFSAFILAMGVLMGLDPLISQAYGSGKEEECRERFWQGLFLALLLAIPLLVWYGLSGLVLRALGQPAELVVLSSEYVHALMPGAAFSLAFFASRQFIQALGRMKPAMVIVLTANGVNVVFNWALIYGHLGFPALGVAGAGYASSASRIFMALALFLYIYKSSEIRSLIGRFKGHYLSLASLIEVWKVGIPVGLQLGLEVWSFALVALGMGWLGARELAAHQIALNLSCLAFMVPMALSTAASVRVGQAIGQKDGDRVRLIWKASLLLVLGLSGGFFLLFLLAPHWLVSLYTGKAGLVALIVSLLPLAAFFQVADGLQVVHSGLLRGARDTRVPMVINLVSHWLIGIPLGFLLTFGLGLGPYGLWLGLMVGTSVVALLLILRVRKKL